mmetsp:Transcript_5566/g.24734  ORF Transcript_5566/g.24734 Transcript_5566/m.24734 type:complete len:201 (+) Transcript_5566:1101-1703(+)
MGHGVVPQGRRRWKLPGTRRENVRVGRAARYSRPSHVRLPRRDGGQDLVQRKRHRAPRRGGPTRPARRRGNPVARAQPLDRARAPYPSGRDASQDGHRAHARRLLAHRVGPEVGGEVRPVRGRALDGRPPGAKRRRRVASRSRRREDRPRLPPRETTPGVHARARTGTGRRPERTRRRRRRRRRQRRRRRRRRERERRRR